MALRRGFAASIARRAASASSRGETCRRDTSSANPSASLAAYSASSMHVPPPSPADNRCPLHHGEHGEASRSDRSDGLLRDAEPVEPRFGGLRVGIELEHLLEVGDALLPLLELLVGEPAVVVGEREILVALDGEVIVGDRQPVLLPVILAVGAVVIREPAAGRQ